MIDLLERHREPIIGALTDLIDASAAEADRVSPWAADLRSRLIDFAVRGKLFRGAIVAAIAEAFHGEPGEDLYRVAAAVELIQSFLLIHDDIMDEDALRRGEPAIFEQYRRLGERDGYTGSNRFGESMGICLGDFTALLAIGAIANCRLEPSLRSDLVGLVTSEIGDVAIAQMADVANGHRVLDATEEEILAVNRYKTGRYTFSLPLMAGAMIAGATEPQISALSRWGELQGIIYQLRDDQLGIMEDEDATGKPAVSDVTSDKQTLHRLLLLKALSGTRWEHVRDYFGSDLSHTQIEELRTAISESGVLREVDSRVDDLQRQSDGIAAEIGGNDDVIALLERIACFNRERRA